MTACISGREDRCFFGEAGASLNTQARNALPDAHLMLQEMKVRDSPAVFTLDTGR